MRHKLDQLITRPGDIKLLEPVIPQRRVLWTVDLAVTGRHGSYTWTGFALTSTEAAELAKRDYYGPLFDDELTRKRHPVRVVRVLQVGV